MNTNEIVMALRDMATYDCGFEEESDTVVNAADLIEQLQKELEAFKRGTVPFVRLRGRTEYFPVDCILYESGQVRVRERINVWNTVDFSFIEDWEWRGVCANEGETNC